MAEIIPAVLPKSVEDLREKVAALPPECDLFHFDVLEEDIWAPVDREFEVHLMVERPEEILERWIERGAKRIIAHKSLDTGDRVEFGLAFKLDEPVEEVDGADFLHLMSIAEIGEQGHPFEPKIFDRIREVKNKFPSIAISIDGGVSKDNYQQLFEAGANRLIVGSHFQELWASLKIE